MVYQDDNIYNLKKKKKKKTAAKGMLNIMLIASIYNNMGNAEKTVKHIPKLKFGRIWYLLLFKSFTDLQ